MEKDNCKKLDTEKNFCKLKNMYISPIVCQNCPNYEGPDNIQESYILVD